MMHMEPEHYIEDGSLIAKQATRIEELEQREALLMQVLRLITDKDQRLTEQVGRLTNRLAELEDHVGRLRNPPPY